MLGLKCKVSNLDVVNCAYEQNLLLVPAADNIVRLLPALNIPKAELQEAILRLRKTALSLEAAL